MYVHIVLLLNLHLLNFYWTKIFFALQIGTYNKITYSTNRINGDSDVILSAIDSSA